MRIIASVKAALVNISVLTKDQMTVSCEQLIACIDEPIKDLHFFLLRFCVFQLIVLIFRAILVQSHGSVSLSFLDAGS